MKVTSRKDMKALGKVLKTKLPPGWFVEYREQDGLDTDEIDPFLYVSPPDDSVDFEAIISWFRAEETAEYEDNGGDSIPELEKIVDEALRAALAT